MITAVRLRLLPAPEAAHRAGRVPARLARRAARRSPRSSRPACARRCSTSSTARRSAMLAGAYRARPGAPAGTAACPAEAGFALIVEVDGTRGRGAGPARRSCWSCWPRRRWRCDEPREPSALWRWRDGDQPGRHGACAGRRSARTWCSRSSGWRRASRRFEEIADAPRAALVRVGARRRGQRPRDRARGPRARAGARRGGGGRRGAVRARRSARRLGRRRARGGLAEAGAPRGPVARAARCELHEQIKRLFDPKGLLNPGKKLARYPARSPSTSSRKETPR